MQTADLTIKCTECGCIAMADSTYCPKCSTSHRRTKEDKYALETVRNMKQLALQGVYCIEKLPYQVIYQFICPRYCHNHTAPEEIISGLK
jgi:hypothetical protein